MGTICIGSRVEWQTHVSLARNSDDTYFGQRTLLINGDYNRKCVRASRNAICDRKS